MKTLATRFDKQGFSFEQLERQGNIALFRKRRNHWKPGNYSFETIRVQRHNGFVIAGRTVEAGESYPHSESWGDLAWTDCDIDSARSRYTSLLTPN